MTDFFYIQVPAEIRVLLISGFPISKNQIEQVSKCTNILKLDLSNCNLSLIPNFKKLTNLRILYLHQNQITQFVIDPLADCVNLNYLTLFLNPVSAQGSLRRQVIMFIKSLWAFDFNAVTDEEKYKELRLKPNPEKSRLPWPVILPPKEIKDQNQIVYIVWQELNIIRKAWQRCSVIMTIQRYIKSYLTRKKFKSIVMKKMKILAQVKSIAKHWINFTRNKKHLNQILTLQYNTQFEKIRVMVKNYRQRKGKAIKEQKSARMIFKCLKQFQSQQKHYLEEIGSVYRMYFLKDQLKLFKVILSRLSKQQEIRSIIESTPLMFDDFQKQNKIYDSDVFTYRLPNQWNMQNNPLYQKNILTFPASISKLSCCLQQLKLSIIRKWAQTTKFNQDVHAYQYLQKYDELMPARKSYFIMYKLSKTDRMKYENRLKSINKFQQREYRQLYVITLSKEILPSILKCIVLHNKIHPQQIFVTIFEKQLKEAVAALKIQRQFRGYTDVKKNGKSLQSIINILVQERSLLILQKWFKDIKMHHRSNFYKSIAHRLKQINNNVLYINFSIYLALNKCKSKIQFLEQTSKICMINYKFHAYQINLPCKSVIPIWLRKSINKNSNQSDDDAYAFQKDCDIYHLLHYDTQCEIKNLFGEKWMKIEFPSDDQFKTRLFFLALFTYSFKNQCFVQMYSESELFESFQSIKYQDQKLITTYHLQIQNYIIEDCDIPHQSSIWLSVNQTDKIKNEIEVRFYKNGINNKSKKKKNIAKLPGCEQISKQLFYCLSKKKFDQTIYNLQKQNCPTASTNIRTVTQTDKPRTALQTYIFQQQDSFEQETSSYERQQQRLKLVTNPTRQQTRTKSVTTKRQGQQVELPSFLQSQSFNLSQSVVKKRMENDYSRQQQYWEDREYQQRLLIKKQRKEQNKTRMQLQQERTFYQDFHLGQNLISRQGDRHLIRLAKKRQQQSQQQQIDKQKEQQNHIKEIVNLNSKMKLQSIRENYQIYKASLEQPEEQPTQIVMKQQQQCRKVANKYIHSVLPEEIFPIKIENM